MSKTIQLDDSILPPAMVAYRRREQVAELIYDWIHENQVTHRKAWGQRAEEDKAQYRKVAASIDAIYEAAADSVKDSEEEDAPKA